MQRQSTEDSRKEKRWCGDEPRTTAHKRQAKAMLRMETQYEKRKAKAKRREDTTCAGEERQTTV